MKRYVQINIGRGNLSHEEWLNFAHFTTIALRESARGETEVQVELHEGAGCWGDEIEDSTHISTIADVDLYALRVKLAKLKKQYNQEAIALIVGSDLI